MPLMVFAIVLFAAVLHASWNALVKAAPDKLLTTIMVAAAAALLSAALLPFLPAPTLSSVPYVLASTLLQILYFVLVARIYEVTDMSEAYPLMRGSAPLIVAIVTALWMEDSLSFAAWLGVSAICFGVLIIALGSQRENRGAYLWHSSTRS